LAAEKVRENPDDNAGLILEPVLIAAPNLV